MECFKCFVVAEETVMYYGESVCKKCYEEIRSDSRKTMLFQMMVDAVTDASKAAGVSKYHK